MASKVKESSTNAQNLKVLAASCEVNEVLKEISPRWKMQILHSISEGIQQFGMLKEAFPSLSDQVLGKRLGELVKEGLVSKTGVAHSLPPQFIYATTPKGAALLTVIHTLHHWGKTKW